MKGRLEQLRLKLSAILSTGESDKLTKAAALFQTENECSDIDYIRESEMKNTIKLSITK